MTLVPIVHCRSMQESVTFYTKVLDFELIGRWPDLGDPALSLLVREGSELHLSSHRGDGAPGQAIIVLTTDIDALFMKFRVRGLVPVSDSPAYLGPTDQTSGTREFHVDDPTGNTLRFVQRPS